MCQVAHCALCVVCTTCVHNPGPWPSVWQGHWVPQAVGPIEFGYRGGGLGTPKARPGPPMGHPIAPQLLHAVFFWSTLNGGQAFSLACY